MSDSNKDLSEHFSPEEVERLRTILDTEKQAPTPATKTVKRSFSIAKTPKWLIFLVAVAVTIALAFVYVKFVDPWIAQINASSALKDAPVAKPIVAQNDKFLPFKPDAKKTGEIPPGVNPKQLALAEKGKITAPSVFIFASANASKKSHTLDIYMDFNAQRSRDFITLNKDSLEYMIKSGKLILRVHPVLTKEPFSVQAPEALAEIFGTAPTKAWGFFTNTLKDSIQFTGTETPDQIVAFVAKHAQDNGGTQVNAASIVNGTFLTWLYTTSDDTKLKVGYEPPVIYVDNKELDQSKWSINNSTQMLQFFSSLS